MVPLIKKSLKRFLKTSLWIILLSSPMIILSQLYPTAFAKLEEDISDDALFFILFRWGLILLLMTGWKVIIYKISRWRHWKGDKRRYWLLMKWRVIGWLIVFELLVCENILTFLF